MKGKKYFIVLTAFAIAIFSGCSGFQQKILDRISNKSFSNGSKWIPDDYDPKTSILLIEKSPGIEEFVAKKFPYRYEVAPRDLIKDRTGKYADTKLYRFGLLWTSASYTHSSGGPSGSFNVRTSSYCDGYFYDRSTDKPHRRTYKTNSYANLGYMPVINTITRYFESEKKL